MTLTPQVAMLFAVSTAVGFLMILSGIHKKALDWTRRGRLCPSCGRSLRDCSCISPG